MTAAIRVMVNGTLQDTVSTQDRGLLYGDGVFETLACRDGRLQYWPQHLQRLMDGCERLALGHVDASMLLAETRTLLDAVHDGVIKILVTRGCGGRGYRPPRLPQPTRVIQLHAWPDYPAANARDGVQARLCDTRLSMNPRLAGIKHLNRLEQVLARSEWDDGLISEGLMCDTAGHLVEGTMSNLFMVRAGCLLTPDLTQCGIAGIMRARLLALAGRHGIPASVTQLQPGDLHAADEVFICNSLIGIWPLIRVGAQAFSNGPVTSRLQELLAADAAA